MLTKLKAAAAALVLGVVAAGAIVSAQPPGGRAARAVGPRDEDADGRRKPSPPGGAT